MRQLELRRLIDFEQLVELVIELGICLEQPG
jgi:hypothetical protein